MASTKDEQLKDAPARLAANLGIPEIPEASEKAPRVVGAEAWCSVPLDFIQYHTRCIENYSDIHLYRYSIYTQWQLYKYISNYGDRVM